MGQARRWHLHNGRISYVMRVLENGWLGHLPGTTGAVPVRRFVRLRRSPAYSPGDFTARLFDLEAV